jgi:signal transduction histidine kinase
MIFELPTAAIIFWGPDQIQLYNDGYSVIMGPRHPKHLGSTFRECWPEAYDSIYPWMQRVLEKGETVEVNRTLVPLTRFGFTEESYFTFSFSPLRDDAGKIAGILQLVTEVTGELLAERRATALRELSHQTADAKTSTDALRLAAAVLSKYAADLPFCLFYLVDSLDQTRWTLAASSGPPQSPQSIAAVPRAARERTLIPVEDLPTPAFAAPVFAADQQTVVAVLVAGISPRLRFDVPYRGFLELVCVQLATLLTAARAYTALAEVEHANKELEAFSYSVSHDLRAPLRAIDGFSKAFMQDYGGTLNDQGRGYLERVRSGTQRMAQLIEDLLGLSSITRAPLRRQSVNVTEMGRKILRELKERDPQRRVESIVAEDLVATADPRLLAVVLENLLGNAWKFTAKQPAARIEVGWDVRDGGAFFVRDNGAGFDQKYAAKLFTPFQRLHADTEFEGTGVGLATVQRIVARHGGRIWAEASSGHGAAFFFTLGEEPS